MVVHRRSFVGFSTMLIALSGAGCDGPRTASGMQTREAKLNGMTCTLNIKSEKDTELTWAVTDRVIAIFANHRIEVEKNQVTLDGTKKPLPKGVEGVTIEFENNTVTIRADGKPIFGASAK